ncbi:B12-binding domain-containing radical SAM protein [Anaerosalibacter bizertensis]|uniref:B12-binding domain-containing radical SAM protein n=1 Tax=Anaerosalibacter bizertensis TaxID=932217 RepID=A0A9Q4ADQ4_9FIRM|nr:B12-binding domain-containing radical SAM protein [Anaerosalibacter bizertensis]MBV1819153.1 B12-binding domain-containing radical SAM protein [Bacteroidales bacterium MSK.15.36]MCB5560103.1 B12-binding domain-containing radical SAM protein [Anaerosalibacter bizertensis]MCG4565756.1 B12-binding domain-containing radical SAM protein [Anaerosalibacter bizertensis]MCG4583087.1 B12-binding domain-containing radical SAM protein [Anaerosalibacter bizertensis]
MKVLITTLNSKFIHSSLSIRYLKSFCKDIPNIEICEFTINQNKDYIAGEIYKMNPDIIAFSCYIWNLEETLDICNILKIVNPNIKIILGGPEVSFDGEEILKKYDFVDFIIYGEGEITFREFIIKLISENREYIDVKGLIYREEGKIVKNEPRPFIEDLDIIPSPYEDLSGLKNKIVYYESSRGCPFNCQFCLSSTIKGVRFFSLDRVKEDLEKLIDAQVRQVKLVDRTFNTKKEYAMEIMKFIMDKNPENMNFHFEVTAHLLDKEMLDFLSKAKEGLFQFEIGIQSTNPKTIEAIGRTTDIEKAKKVTKIIKGYQNIHQHLDLIAGLPYEDYNSFKDSFNEIYELRPEKLQLGFLKLLKGSGLRENIERYGFKFLNKSPYEVLETKYISYSEMLKLKTIEDLLEKYGNESVFENSLQYIITNYYDTPFDFYEDFSSYWEEKQYHKLSHSKKGLYKILYNFYKDIVRENLQVFNEILKFDYILNNRDSNIPPYLKRRDVEELINKRHDFLKDEENLIKYLPEYKDLPTRKLINKVHFEAFDFNIIDFINENYSLKELNGDKIILLFIYKNNKVLNKCEVKDITEKINKI